jgi:hypothetical protein
MTVTTEASKHYLSKYEQRRNELIPEAERVATEVIGEKHPKGDRADKWSRTFHAEMDRLWREQKCHR